MAAKPKVATPAPSKAGNLFLVYGEDEFQVSAQARALVERLCPPAEQAFGLETIEACAGSVAEAAAALTRAREGLVTRGFLAGRKVVWLKNANFLGMKGVLAESETVKAPLAELVALLKEGLPEGHILVVSAGKVFANGAFFKACKERGELQAFLLSEKPYEQEKEARGRAAELFRQAGLSIPPPVLEAFLAKVDLGTRQLASEVEKLALYLAPRKDVRREDVELVTSPSKELPAWDLADAVGRRSLPDALRILRQLLFQGENEMGLIIALENRFRDLLIYREGLDRRWLRVSGEPPWLKAEWQAPAEGAELLAALGKRDPSGANAFRGGKLVEQARQFSMAELVAAHRLVIATHEGLVSSAVPQVLQLELLLLRLLGPQAKGASAA